MVVFVATVFVLSKRDRNTMKYSSKNVELDKPLIDPEDDEKGENSVYDTTGFPIPSSLGEDTPFH